MTPVKSYMLLISIELIFFSKLFDCSFLLSRDATVEVIARVNGGYISTTCIGHSEIEYEII